MKRNRRQQQQQQQQLASKNAKKKPSQQQQVRIAESKHQQKTQPERNGADDDDDEEIPEDEAFNSDDERKYGAYFSSEQNLKDDDDDENDDDVDQDDNNSESTGGDSQEDDEDDEGDGGQYMLDLLNRLDSNNNNNQNHTPAKSVEQIQLARHVPESQFATSVVPATGLTLDALLQGLESNTQGLFGKEGFQSTMKDLFLSTAGGGGRGGITTTSAPLPKIVTDRMQRQLQYDQEKKNLSSWMDAVQQHRVAETLDFTPKERLANLTREQMVEKFEPVTEFEKELCAAIQQQQEQEHDLLDPNDDDLGSSSKLTLEEYKQRRAQLAKMRALLFYHEVKRHHINKIKSKTYRRIRKKQRQRLKSSELEQQQQHEDGDTDDLVKELQEKEELERVKERMTLAHKNTSKWAKRVLKRGKNVDLQTRRALSAQLQRGDDLRKKMSSVVQVDDDDDDDDPSRLLESAQQVLADIDQQQEDTKGEAKGIFKLAFMQRGIEKQRQRAREEARQLLMELQADAEDDVEHGGNDHNDRDDKGDNAEKCSAGIPPLSDASRDQVATSASMRTTANKEASQQEMQSVLSEGKLVANSLAFGKASTEVAVDGAIEIDLDSSSSPVGAKSLVPKTMQATSSSSKKAPITISLTKSAVPEKSPPRTTPASNTTNGNRNGNRNLPVAERGGSHSHHGKDDNDEDKQESNPWIQAALSNGNADANRTKTNKIKTITHVDVQEAVQLLLSESDKKLSKVVPNENKQDTAPNNNGTTTTTLVQTNNTKKKIITLTQEELVRRAFYSDSHKEVEEEFAKEKQALIERDDNDVSALQKMRNKNDRLPKVVAGWGNWTGEGAPEPKPPRALPKHLQPPESKPLAKRKRQDEKKPNVIINEKRIKKTANQFQIANVPYPYTSREEYERAMTGGIGREWNVTSGFKNLTRPEILTRSGKIIQPISKRAKTIRPAAKF